MAFTSSSKQLFVVFNAVFLCWTVMFLWGLMSFVLTLQSALGFIPLRQLQSFYKLHMFYCISLQSNRVCLIKKNLKQNEIMLCIPVSYSTIKARPRDKARDVQFMVFTQWRVPCDIWVPYYAVLQPTCWLLHDLSHLRETGPLLPSAVELSNGTLCVVNDLTDFPCT